MAEKNGVWKIVGLLVKNTENHSMGEVPFDFIDCDAKMIEGKPASGDLTIEITRRRNHD